MSDICPVFLSVKIQLALSGGALSAKWQPIIRGFNTGYCGSCTTFATWQLVVGVQLLNGQWVNFVTLSGLTFATSYIAMLIGIHLGELVKQRFFTHGNISSVIVNTGDKDAVHQDGIELGSVCSDSMHSHDNALKQPNDVSSQERIKRKQRYAIPKEDILL